MVLPGRDIKWKAFLLELKEEFERDDLMDVAGSLTFFGILAIFPFLLFLVSLAALVIDPTQAQLLIDELGRVAPPAVVEILGGRLEALGEGGSPELLTFSAVGAIWSASTGIAALMRALNRAYDVRESRPIWKVRGIAVATTLVAATISVLATAAAVAAPAVAGAIGGWPEQVILWLRLPVAGLLIMLVWALLYYFLPDVEQRFRFITPGSVVGVIIWLLASTGFSIYVANFGNYEVSYGALGGVIILLFWMWISSMVVLLGAEINAVLEHLSPEGKRVGARRMDQTGSDLPKTERHKVREARRLPAPSAVGPASCVDEKPGAGLVVRRREPVVRRRSLALPGALFVVGFLLGRRRR
ncbi:YihY/virulence factor BrkB family protein [Vulgatibacter sp.]|uniref:YihY/virulence factor BrkB family protein n=1 Tax=Vulgatibacter sp. TaxID=1971226 RepID=UPI00356860DD